MSSPKPSLHWDCRFFSELSNLEVYRMLSLRESVFVVEQHCPYQEADGLDIEALHLFGWAERPGAGLAAYLRILPPGLKSPRAWLGRIIVAPPWRGKGVGKQLILHAFQEVHHRFGAVEIAISAQYALTGYYRELGFRKQGTPYDEDGIKHICMIKEFDK